MKNTFTDVKNPRTSRYTQTKDSFSGTVKGVVPLDSTEIADKIKQLVLEIVELSKQVDDSNIDYPY